TYSVGLVGGGTSINAIPSEAWLQVDLRSEGVEELARLDRAFFDAVGSGVADETALRAPSGSQLACDVKLLGERPAGATPPELPIVQAAWWATREVGLEPVLDSGSTDAGAPTALGIPAICIGGGGTAGDLHSLSEWFDPTDAFKGVQRALLTILALDLAHSTAQEV
ncbi:MAG: peptidase M20, partial [Acidobacteria bacterium]|nr:peptidase M20 [Acidobacteriota bacterium]